MILMTQEQTHKQGLLYAISAFVMWGIAPIYFKMIGEVPAMEILLHRVLWSFLFVIVLIIASGGGARIRQVFREQRKLLLLMVTSVLIGLNWLLFIWAVNNDHMLDASLGYYINPLLNVVLGTLFLGERLRKFQWLAVLLAVAGVLVELISFGSVPWISLVLASSFGIYGLIRKKVAIDAISGLFIETLLLTPLALVYFLLMPATATSDLGNNSWQLNALLLSAGVVTTLPLLAFAAAAVRIPLSTLGFIQYIGPSLMLLIAVFIYGEAFSAQKMVTFGFIWAALAIYSLDGLKQSYRKRKAA